MYLSFFGLSRSPFETSPQPDRMFDTAGHSEALAALIYGITEHRGFVAVTGDVGVGKTTTLMAAVRHVTARYPNLILIEFNNPVISPKNLLEIVAGRIGLPEAPEPDGVLEPMQERLLQLRESGRQVVLIFDEAQSIPAATLEFLRIISNLDGNGRPLFVIIFSGQREFEEIMRRPENRALDQRIAIRARLAGLTPATARDYIKHRLESAGGEIRDIMTPGAIAAIVRHAGAIPRRMNILADNALIAGFGHGHRPITAGDVRSARGSLGPLRPPIPFASPALRRITPAAGFTALGAIAAALFAIAIVHEMTPPPPPGGAPADPLSVPAVGPAPAPPVLPPKPAPSAQPLPVRPPVDGATGAFQIGKPAALLPNPPPAAAPKAMPVAAAPSPVSPDKDKDISYTLKHGDTVYKIFRKYSIDRTPQTLDIFRRYNPNFSTLDQLYPNQIVIIPGELLSPAGK